MTAQPVKRQHPTLSDVALALATKQRSERMFGGKISDANQRGNIQVEVEWHSPDPDDAQIASNLYDTLRAKYPRENGGAK